mmetsp:Transcript_112574/g.357796  ORF Transcript_112574/g.357796 Transcript_112574/m.357796 type:complete len:130 (+) Transcript_112574:562-951(+)
MLTLVLTAIKTSPPTVLADSIAVFATTVLQAKRSTSLAGTGPRIVFRNSRMLSASCLQDSMLEETHMPVVQMCCECSVRKELRSMRLMHTVSLPCIMQRRMVALSCCACSARQGLGWMQYVLVASVQCI